MPRYRQHSLFILNLLALWLLLFLGHNWEEGLKMDAMENASIAKFILSTGNWKSFRYELEAYSQYFNHPPLVIWLEALFFKVFGVSDSIARLVPALFGLGTLAGVVLWGEIALSIEAGLLAGWVLLTSNRYIKFASDVLLEGPLCFFLVWGTFFFLKSQEKSNQKRIRYSFLVGLCLGGAFLTKSVFFIILPLSLVTAFLLNRSVPKNSLLVFSGTVAGFLLVLAVWFGFGDGLNFLTHHYSAISSRVESRNWATFLVPTKNILTTYWPWLPFLFWGLGKLLKNTQELNLGKSIAFTMSLIVLVMFSLAGHFFEHYLTTFYPPASILVSISLYPLLKPRFKLIEKVLWGLTVFLAVALAVLPINLRKNRAEPLATTLREMSAVCHGQKELLITRTAMDRWLAVAITLWKTPYEIKSIESVDSTPQAGQLLITSKDETPPSAIWEKVPLCHSRFNLYQSKQFQYCRRSQ